MGLQAFGLLLLSIVANVAVQFLMKAGGTRVGKVSFTSVFEHFWSFITTPELVAGVVCSALSAIAYFLVLTRVELSIAGPASALVYIFSVLIGHFWFKEAVPLSHLIGLGLIVCGIVLVSSKTG